MISTIGIFLAASFILWVFFVNVMWLKDNRDDINKYLQYPLMAFAAVGFLFDVVYNITIGSIVFLQKPDFKGANTKLLKIPLPTLTERLRDILRYGHKGKLLDKYRWKVAKFTCKRLIEPWDQGHCAIRSET